ncbi:MAG: hypothetical protein FWG16_02180 [Micrococcales bacterium]|nr:hypothetical protein [Micrococcales bacterium]
MAGPPSTRQRRLDPGQGERWLFLSFAAPLALVLTLAMVLEWTLAVTWWDSPYPNLGFATNMTSTVWVTTLVPTLMGVVALLLVYPVGKPWWWKATLVVLVSMFVVPLRLAVQLVLWGTVLWSSPWLLDAMVGTITAAATLGLAVYLAGTQMSAVRSERLAAQHEYQSRQVALELENEELRVRREVSDFLHGRLQQRLVFLAAELDQLKAVTQIAENDQARQRLETAIKDLDQLREDDVRELSHSLFPVGLGLGLAQALTLQVAKVPAQVAVELEIDPLAGAIDDVTNPQLELSQRMLLVQAVEEGITNAIKHGRATALTIRVALGSQPPERTAEDLVVTVTDQGQPLPVDGAELSGLSRLRNRARQHGGDLELRQLSDGQVQLRVWVKHHVAPGSLPSAG